MAMYTYEGTKNFIAVYPAIIVSLVASGSVTAGNGLAFDAGNTSEVYVPTCAAASGTECAGIALNTASDNGRVEVGVLGFFKNLVAVSAFTPAPGDRILLSGSGTFTSCTSGSFLTNPYAVCGKVVSGSVAGGRFMAFINCLK
jgi:hypothetical protein